MTKPPFIITIDTEGDNLWSRPQEIETRNAGYLPRFQELCEAYDQKPTYLVNYEMAISPAFVDFARDVQARGTGEIGMHLHAWNSPPLAALTDDDNRFHPYLIEYPDEAMAEKIGFMTKLLEDTFGTKMVSHRAGRWAFDARYARILLDHGYKVDCSITPHVSWSSRRGDPAGRGGSNYRNCPETLYFTDPNDPKRPGASALLEVPMTVKRRGGRFGRLVDDHTADQSLMRRAVQKICPLVSWLRPNGRNRSDMLALLDQVLADGTGHAEFMLHSSEFMPGGSPTFRDDASIEALYDDMAALFEAARDRFTGSTLAEVHARTIASDRAYAAAS
ncbi:MAG: deacetylase [Geminicoccaceae bacterium]